MAEQGPAEATQPSTEARPPPAKADGQAHAVTSPLGEEGIFELRGDSPEGLLAPAQQAQTQQQRIAAGSVPPPLARPELGRAAQVLWVRFIIALLSLGTLVFVVVATFLTLWRTHVPIDYLMRVLEVIFAPLVALVGVAVAFYFRGKDL